MGRKTTGDYTPEVLELFDRYVHGGISRREFLKRAGGLAVGGLGAMALLEGLGPNYALAAQVEPDDDRIRTKTIRFASPRGHGEVHGLLARPRTADANLGDPRRPGVLVVHENRGLNPYIEDVARRLAVEGFIAFAPDGLSSVGGYPGNDDEGRRLQAGLHREALIEDFLAGAKALSARPECSGRVGVVGFCFGGMVSNELAVRWPELGAAVPFYGRQPALEDVARIRAPLLLHFAETDPRVNAGWPDYERALLEHGVPHEAHVHPGTHHGFHNDTTPPLRRRGRAAGLGPHPRLSPGLPRLRPRTDLTPRACLPMLPVLVQPAPGASLDPPPPPPHARADAAGHCDLGVAFRRALRGGRRTPGAQEGRVGLQSSRRPRRRARPWPWP